MALRDASAASSTSLSSSLLEWQLEYIELLSIAWASAAGTAEGGAASTARAAGASAGARAVARGGCFFGG
jgi:hypothetical protein